MRRILSSVCVALCLALPIVWAGCAATSTRQSTGDYVDDSVITSKVKTDLAQDKILSLFQISVETYNGVVQLSGFVNSRETADHAASIARQVKGVREVKNSLAIKTQ